MATRPGAGWLLVAACMPAIVGQAPPVNGPRAAPSVAAREVAILAGSVLDAARRGVRGAEVTFHYHATFGVAWLRSGADEVVVARGTTDAAGLFAFSVPAGVAGTCVVEAEQGRAIATACVAGELLRLQLAPPRTRVFRMLTAAELPAAELQFEGPTPLAAATIHPLDGQARVPLWPGLGAVLLLPEGFVGRDSGAAWIGVSGLPRERLHIVSNQVRGVPARWSSPLDVPAARRGPVRGWWGSDQLTVVGQLADGQPFVARGDACVRAPAAPAQVVRAHGVDAAILAAGVMLAIAPDDAVAVAAAERLTASAEGVAWPTWAPSPAAALVLGHDAGGWRVLPAPAEGDARGESAAWTLRGTVRGDDRVPVAGARLRLRPSRCRPSENWHSFVGLEVVSGAQGAFVLPVRLSEGGYDWIGSAPDGRTVSGTVQIAAADQELSIELADGGELRGLVIDSDGEPIAGLAVDLRAGKTEVPSSFGWPEHRTHTGPDGEFVLRGLDAELPYELTCGSAAWGEVVVDGVRAGSTGLSLQLRPPATPR